MNARLPVARRPWRLDADPEDVGRSLAGLVLAILELLRELLERQAIRRMDSGGLTAEQVERLGLALLELKGRLTELREAFGLKEQDIRLPPGLVSELRERAAGPYTDNEKGMPHDGHDLFIR
jgi:Gas vesicle protein K